MERRLIIFVPLERIKERYCDQWYRWFRRDFKTFKELEVKTVMGGAGATKIETGEWLDVYGTNRFKAQQLAKVVRLLKKHRGRDITVFFMDLWFPGLEALFYIRSLAPQPFKIKGILHAGSYSPGDLLNRKGQAWATWIEQSWFANVDEIFVGSDWHRRLLINQYGKFDSAPITVVSFPVYTNEGFRRRTKKDIIVFPNRLHAERQPEKWSALQVLFINKYPELSLQTRFIRSSVECRTKAQYYDLLSRAKAVVTTPTNENFGIAVKEAENLGAIAIVPDNFAYREHHYFHWRYRTLDEAADKIAEAIRRHARPMPMWDESTKDIIGRL